MNNNNKPINFDNNTTVYNNEIFPLKGGFNQSYYVNLHSILTYYKNYYFSLLRFS